MRKAWLFRAFLVASLLTAGAATSQDRGNDPDRVGPPTISNYRSVMTELAPLERPFRLTVTFDSSGKNPTIALQADLPDSPGRRPQYPRYQAAQLNDSTLGVVISYRERPSAAPEMRLPAREGVSRTLLQLVYRSDTALFALESDSLKVHQVRKASFVTLKVKRPKR
jgi:hypothetical protein